MRAVFLCVAVCLFGMISALDNGLALTPPMGWLSWERFRCNVDCVNDPKNCIGEKLFMDMADLVVSEGYKDVGYEYINIDDCWLAKERDPKTMQLMADPERFPSGMKALADYVHSKGLKLGIYEDFGTKTCGGYPGSEYYLELDAQTFADWGIDYLKLDGCYSDPHQYDDAYPAMSNWMNKTGHPMVFSCSWPAYQEGSGQKVNYTRLAGTCNLARNNNDIQDSWDSLMGVIQYYGDDEGGFAEAAGPGFWNDPDMINYARVAATCNLARNYNDITDSWDSLISIINYYGDDKLGMAQYAKPGYYNDPDEPDYVNIAKYCNLWRNAGDIQDSWDSLISIIGIYGDDKTNFQEVAAPGNWNDPDMVIIGNFGLSWEQERVQMALWAIMASPLIMSNDLRDMRNNSKALLQNKNAIAINQDAMGKQGKRIMKIGNVQVWTRPILPKGSLAFAFINQGTSTPTKVSVALKDLGLTSTSGYSITEVFEGTNMGSYTAADKFTVPVNPTGVFFGKASLKGAEKPKLQRMMDRFKQDNWEVYN